MEKEIKHRLKRSRRRERAERMQAQRDHGDSAEDETLTGVKPHRPPIRRKKTKEPTFEEDIIDGFAILAFRSYEELEMAVKMATTKSTKYNLLEDKIRSQGNIRVINHHSPAPGHDAGTSDDSGRASEVRPPGLPHGHRESSHDHLSDASSRCSSGRGYICDSEGEDDKGSDAGSIFAATPASTPRKSDASEAGGTQTTLIVNGVGTPPVAPHQSNGVTENTKTSLSAALLNFSSPQLDKGLSSDAERSAKPRFDNFGLAANEKSRPDVNCSGFEKRLESNTHAECKRLESNTHQNVVNNLEMKLECLPHHVDKGRLDGIQADKNIHFEKNAVLDKSRLDSVNLDKTRVDGIPVHMLDNMSLSTHVEKKRTLDVIPNFDKCAKDTKIEKCLENSNVHGPLNLDKRKDSHLAPVLGDKGRIERETSVEHAGGNSPTLSNPGPLLPHLNSSVLQNSILHQPAVVAGTNPVTHKPLPSNHIYQNSIRAHLHNPGLPSHNGTSLQFPLKKPVVLHGGPNMPSSVRPSMMPAPSVPTATTSVSPVISSSTSNTLPLSNVGIATTLPTTLSLSNSGTVSGILQHATLHPISHMGNQRTLVEPILSHRPGNSPQPGNGSARPPNDSISSGPRVNTPMPQHQVLAPSHPTSHVGSQVVHGRLSPTAISSSSSTSVTITTAPSGTTATTSSDFPVCSSINVSSTISFHSGSASVTSTSVGTVNQSGGIQEPRSPGMHSGYSLPLPGGSFSYPSLYGPYSTNIQHPSYLPVSSVGSPISKTPSVVSGAIATPTCTASIVASCTTASHRDVLSASASNRIHSPRGHSPTRERDSYSSNVSSLSRGSTTPVNRPPSASPFSAAPSSSLPNPSPYAKNPVWGISTPGPASARSSLHPSNFPAPIFAQPLPPPGGPPGPAPFSAESLFQTNQADLLRRELDNRFLASQERAIGVAPAFLRTEMHHHQHQHTHVHQHQAPALYPPPLFKDIPKLGSVDSPFYRGNLGLVSYPGFSPGLLGPGIPSTPFAPPSHLPTFTPKQVGDASKPRILKTGKWNAMHVRVAWEIYHHQQKQSAENKSGLAGSSSSKETLLRPSGHLFPSSGPRHDLGGYPPGFLPPPPPPHIGATVTPFGRYPPMGSFGAPPSNFPGLAGFSTREIPSLTSIPSVHDPWRLRGPNAFSVSPSPWSLKPEPTAMERREIEEREREREREREKERIRREREERERDRERREREEKRKLELERERREKDRRELEKRELERYNKVRDRSPIRNGDIKEEPRSAKEEDVVILGRTGPGGSYPPHPYGMGRHSGLRPPPLTPHFTPSTWPPPPGADPFAYRLDPLLRYNPLVPFRQEEEDQRSKLYGVGGYPLPPHASHHQSSSPVLMKKEESQSR